MFNRLSFAKSLLRPTRRASTFVKQSQDSFTNFNALLGERKNQMDSLYEDFKSSLREKTESQRVYTHPLDDKNVRVVFEHGKLEELWLDMVGPEQVSPHYENFLMSRKFAVGIWTTVFASSLLANTRDFSWLIQTSFMPFVFFASTLYFFYEGRKSMFL